jgi:hypothetical protein
MCVAVADFSGNIKGLSTAHRKSVKDMSVLELDPPASK